MGDERPDDTADDTADEPPPEPTRKAFIDQVFEDQGRAPTPEEAVALGLAMPDPDLPDDLEPEPLPAIVEPEPEPEPEPGPELAPDEEALVDEAMKKSGLIWVSTPNMPAGRAFWHAWVEGVAYLLTGPDEQPDPDWPEGSPVSVLVRSKDNQHRLVSWDAVVTRVDPADDDWEPATSALAAGRLNLRAAESAPRRWATGRAVIYRLRPAGTLRERPGDYPDGSHRTAPVPTPATTADRKPWVLGPRGRAGLPLS